MEDAGWVLVDHRQPDERLDSVQVTNSDWVDVSQQEQRFLPVASRTIDLALSGDKHPLSSLAEPHEQSKATPESTSSRNRKRKKKRKKKQERASRLLNNEGDGMPGEPHPLTDTNELRQALQARHFTTSREDKALVYLHRTKLEHKAKARAFSSTKAHKLQPVKIQAAKQCRDKKKSVFGFKNPCPGKRGK